MSESQPAQPNSNQSVIPSYEDMLKAGLHYGRKRTVFNPGMSRFVYAIRDRIHIIDVIKTETQLRAAIAFLKSVKKENGVILWVSLTKQSEDKIKEIAEVLKMPYVTHRWLGGFLTNFSVIKSRIDFYKEMEQKKKEEYKTMTKKERHDFDIDFRKLKDKYEGIKNMDRLPDAIFFASLHHSASPIRETKRMEIKTVAVVNTESDPTAVEIPIPANDNARQSINLILDAIKKGMMNQES